MVNRYATALTNLDPFQLLPIRQTGVRVSRLGFGASSIGGLYEPVSEEVGLETLDHAWNVGIRYFDVAPLYGYGIAERRVGTALQGRSRDAFALSTKVGRLLYPAVARTVDETFPGAPPYGAVFDFSRDGTLRSIEASLERLRLDRIDIAFIHDPDAHWEEAIEGAYPALAQLRDEGSVGAIGVGMNQTEMLARFAREGDFDVFLVAGRYTLLDQSALPELLPLCLEKRIAVVLGGVMNSGLLADPKPGAMFNYSPADAGQIETAQRIASICHRHGVPLKAAAIQFPQAHPAVVSLLAGVRRIDHLDEYPLLTRYPIPPGLWADLVSNGLLSDGAPVPASPSGT